jgi:hypothetical protein
MKQPVQIDHDGQNWHWPQKTWFRERLSAIKSQDDSQRHGPIVKSAKKPGTPKADANGSLKAR